MAPGRFRQLNPAFAAAHGLAEQSSDGTVKISPSNASGVASPDLGGSAVITAGSSQKRVRQAIIQARKTGKLNSSNLGLFKLPDEVFDLRKGISVDLSLSASSSTTLGSHGEETLTLVDFSDNPIGRDGSELDERILCYKVVQIIRLRRCELKSSINFQPLENLSLLDLSGNALSTFSLEQIPSSLQELNLSSNDLESLDVGDTTKSILLPYLTHLDLSENRVSKLPLASELRCPKLQIFKCNKNMLTELPIQGGGDSVFLTGSCKALQTLDVSHNKLTEAMDFSVDFSVLKTIHLSENQLKFPPCLPSSAVQVALGGNKIKSVTGLLPTLAGKGETQLTDHPALVDLLLADNQLEVLDANVVKRLRHLHRLDIQANVLKNLPYELGFLPHLHNVSLAGNPLVSFKSSELTNTQTLLSKLRKRAPSDKDSKVPGPSGTRTGSLVLASSLAHNPKVLTLKKANLLEIPASLLEELESSDLAFSIKGVNLESNQIQSVPERFINLLPGVTSIQINRNILTSLPGNLVFTPLVELSLSRNLLTSEAVKSALFGDEIQGRSNQSLSIFKTLQMLDLSSNRITEFPCFATFSSLRILSLCGNQISSIEHWSSFPLALEVLNLSENAIADLGEIPLYLKANCPQLNSFLMRQNNLKQVPATLGLLDSVKFLDLKGNPQRLVRPNILEKSGGEIVAYLRNRLTPEQKLCAENRIRDINAMSAVELTTQPEPDPEIYKTTKEAQVNVKCCQERTSVEDLAEQGGAIPCSQPPPNPPSVESNKPSSFKGDKIFPGKSKPEADSADKHFEDCESGPSSPSSHLEELGKSIKTLSQQLEHMGLSQAKRYALKKQLAMERSKFIREERRLAQQGSLRPDISKS